MKKLTVLNRGGGRYPTFDTTGLSGLRKWGGGFARAKIQWAREEYKISLSLHQE